MFTLTKKPRSNALSDSDNENANEIENEGTGSSSIVGHALVATFPLVQDSELSSH